MEENNKSTNLFAIASKEIEEEEKAAEEKNSIEKKQEVSDLDNINLNQEIQKIQSNNNPFVDSTIKTEQEIKQEETNTPNNIIQEPQITTNNNNPFVSSIINKNENNQFTNYNIESNNTNEQKKETIVERHEENTSPFFKENQNIEAPANNELNINPFFRNDMDLTEKTEHQNQDKLDLTKVQHFNVKIEKKKPGKLKFVIGVLSYAIFIWLLLIGVTLLVYVANIKIKQLKGDYTPPKYNAYVVLTGSMLPSIKVEDVVVTKKIDPKDLKEGDIITFASSDERFYGTVITHRIKKKYYDSTTKKYTYVSKGDNNNIEDSALVEQDRIYGKVILKIPKLGYLQIFLASQGGWILVILLPCLTVISFDIMKILKIIGKKSKLKITK